MTRHYIFFTRNVLPQPNAAHLVHAANSANAAASLGYPAILLHLKNASEPLNVLDLLNPLQLKKPGKELIDFYNLQDTLKVSALPVPKITSPKYAKKLASTLSHPSTLISKYYFPVHIRSIAQVVHSRDWNFVKTAIQNGIPAIYEHHHHEEKQFEPEIVRNPLFQLAITVADTVRESMIQNGMPANKIVKLHSGFNSVFLHRQPEEVAAWRQQLLSLNRQHLVVYSGALRPFKGTDLLLDVAKELPHVQFAIAGGSETDVKTYQQRARNKELTNVTFLGYLSHTQLPGLLQAADILVHPHCSGPAATFTSPLKLFDYLASGSPIVATEIPSLMEFKPSQAIAGWCDPDNPIQLARCIQRVLETHPRKPEGYRKNIEYVRQFSWENRFIKILSHLDSFVRTSPAFDRRLVSVSSSRALQLNASD